MKGHAPRKRFGQNFLVDTAAIDRIMAAIAPRPGEHIVEIGPGQGALTLPLAASGARLTLIELDRDLAAGLAAAPALANARVIQADALDVDLAELAGSDRIRLVGNLPYNVSTPLLFHVLGAAGHVRDAHFMLQAEVVDRMVAAPGGKAYGRLSVMLQVACRVERLFRVRPGAFRPVPRVDSAVVRLEPRENPAAGRIEDRDRFAQVVKAAFAQRRKQLGNSLRGLVGIDTLHALDMDPTRRAETLTPEEYVALANASLTPVP